MDYLNFLKLQFNAIGKKLSNLLRKVRVLLEKFYIVRLTFSLKKKMDDSLLFFSLFLLWGFFSVTTSRGIAIWYFGWWAHLNTYLFSTGIYLFLSIMMILKRYLQSRGYFQIFKENQAKLRLYENYVCRKHKIELNIAFRRTGKFLLFSTFLFYNLFFYFNSAFFLWILLVLSLNLFLYFLNSVYSWWFFFKTPVPEDMQLRPPKVLSLFYKSIKKRVFNSF